MRQKNNKKNNVLAELIKARWSNIKDETEKIFKEEIKTEKTNEILKIVDEILDFNKKN